MKKALALVLALVMVFSMGTMAFADGEGSTTTTTTTATKIVCGFCDSEGFKDSTELKEHQEKYHAVGETFRNDCPVCGNWFANEADYNDHIAICEKNQNGLSVNISIQEILDTIVTLASGSMTQWNDIEQIIIKLIGFFEKIAELGVNAVSQAEVKGAVADLEAALADVKLPKLDELLNSLKQKVKDLYAGEVATTVVIEDTTVADEPVKTGSSSVGIALFAAVSVAAAAAYVCTKKSK